MDKLLSEHKDLKQKHHQLYTSYQELYSAKEEEVNQLNSQCSNLQAELCKLKQGLASASGHGSFVQMQPEITETDKDTVIAVMSDQRESEKKAQIELNAKLVEMRNNSALLRSQNEAKDGQIAALMADKDDLEKRLNSKDVEMAELIVERKELENKLAQEHARIITSTPTTTHVDADSNKDTEWLQGSSSETRASPYSSSALITATPEKLTLILAQKEQTIAKLNEEIQQLKKWQPKSSGDNGVGDPCVEHTASGVSYNYSSLLCTCMFVCECGMYVTFTVADNYCWWQQVYYCS